LDGRGNIKTENYMTEMVRVFAAVEIRREQSLVAWAIPAKK